MTTVGLAILNVTETANFFLGFWTNSLDPEQTAPRGEVSSGSALFAIASSSFGGISLL